MIVTFSNDARIVYRKNLSDNAVHVLVDCQRQEVKTLESMMVSCGTSTTFTLIYNDGVTDFYLYNAVTLAANTTLPIADFHPKLGYLNGPNISQSLKVQAGAGNRISVVAVCIDAIPSRNTIPQGGGFVTGTGGNMVGTAQR